MFLFITKRSRKIYFTKDNTAFYKSKGNNVDVTYMFKKTKNGLELKKKYLKTGGGGEDDEEPTTFEKTLKKYHQLLPSLKLVWTRLHYVFTTPDLEEKLGYADKHELKQLKEDAHDLYNRGLCKEPKDENERRSFQRTAQTRVEDIHDKIVLCYSILDQYPEVVSSMLEHEANELSEHLKSLKFKKILLDHVLATPKSKAELNDTEIEKLNQYQVDVNDILSSYIPEVLVEIKRILGINRSASSIILRILEKYPLLEQYPQLEEDIKKQLPQLEENIKKHI